MTYAETILYQLEAYPSLFPTEIHARHHLFCVYGNGYRWHQGQLLYYRPQTQLARLKKVKAWKFARKRRQWRRRWHGLVEYPSESSERMPPLRSIFPLCEFAALTILPEDIQPDWHAAAQACQAWARTIGHTDEDDAWLDIAQARLGAISQHSTRKAYASCRTIFP